MSLNVKFLLIVLMSIGVFNLAAVEKGKDKESGKKSMDMSIYQFTMKDINGDPFELKSLKGKVALIVNVASKCGFTRQYEGLQEFYKTNKDKGFVILGVPSNDFSRQEPGSNEDIKKFCKVNFGVTFPMMGKVAVIGQDATPLYKFLTDKSIHPKTGGKISWNFNKFLIDKNGFVVERYSSFAMPTKSRKMKKEIALYLNQ